MRIPNSISPWKSKKRKSRKVSLKKKEVEI